MRESPTPLASGKVTDKHNGGCGCCWWWWWGGVEARREAHWDTPSFSLYAASKRNCNGAARSTVLITLFLLWRRVFTCTYAQTHAVCFERDSACVHVRVCKRQGEYCVYTWIYSFKKAGSELESTILFFFFHSGVETHQTHHFSFWSRYTLMISHPV